MCYEVKTHLVYWCVLRRGEERFAWGMKNLRDAGVLRRRYIAETADQHEIDPRLAFARA